MSKAFTKEDDDAGFAPSSSAALASLPAGPFRLTTTGAQLARASTDPRVHEALARAEVLPRIVAPKRAAIGVSVVVILEREGSRKTHRLVSAEERALIGAGCSVEGPIGRALLGAEVGDVREVTLPRGSEELEVIGLEGE